MAKFPRSLAAWARAALTLLALAATPSQAKYIGADPPRRCPSCQPCAQGTCMSRTEGNLSETYTLGATGTASGALPPLTLSYNSYNADTSRARLDTGMGNGWTHGLGTLLYSAQGSIFRLDGEGRVTKFTLGPGGTYTAAAGYFETLVRNTDGSFTLTQKDRTRHDFAFVAGTPFMRGMQLFRLTRITDRNDNATTLAYAGGQLATATDTYGRRLSFSYNALQKLAAVTDPLGRSTTFAYDPAGAQLQRITDPLGRSVQYSYNLLFQITRKTDRDGRVFTYDYRDGLPVSMGDGAQQTMFTMTNPANWATSDSALASQAVRRYQPATTSETDGRGNVWRFQYDANGYVVKTTAPDGATRSTAYDPSTLHPVSETDGNGRTTAYQYDALGNLTRRTDPLGNVTRITYEPVHNQITSITDANGRVTRYAYDARGNRTSETDALGGVLQRSYDARGNLLRVTDRNGVVTSYQYDALGNRTRQTDGAGDVTRYSHDAVGNTVTMTAPNGNLITRSHDGLNRVTSIVDSLGPVATVRYNGNGNRTQVCDGNGHCTSYTYDLRERPVGVTDARLQTTVQAYDGNDNRVSVTDRNGRVTRYAYDALNRLVQTTDALGNLTRQQHDAAGNLLKFTDANGQATVYAYDAANRRISETYADGGVRRFNFDPVGNRSTRTDPIGRTTVYQYDALDRLVRRSYPGGAADTLSYDAGGRLVRAERDGWVLAFTYDGANRVSSATQDGAVVRYNHDIPSGRRALVYPGGRQLTETRDLRDRLSRIDDTASATPIIGYAYDLGNRVVNRVHRNGVRADHGYDDNDRQTSIEHSLGGSRIAGFAYEYDNEGNKRFEARRADGANSQQRSEAYLHDAIDRLVDFRVGLLASATVPAPVTQTQYTLDALGNWSAVTRDASVQTRSHNAVNQIVSIDGGAPLLYDANGNLIEDERYRYSHDEEDRLTGVVRKADGALVGQYRYDVLSRRVQKVANPAGVPATTRYLHDDQRVVEEQGAAGATLATYVYGNALDELLTVTRAGQVHHAHQNALGSVAAVSNGGGGVVERYRYDAYGLPQVTDGAGVAVPANAWGTPRSAIANPVMFTGRQFDEESGLYHYRARALDPVKGRFIQRDPLGYQDGANLYQYVGSAPTRYVDPLGNARGYWSCVCLILKCELYTAGCIAAVPAAVVGCKSVCVGTLGLGCVSCVIAAAAATVAVCEQAYDCWVTARNDGCLP